MAPHGRGWTHYWVGLLLNAIAFAGLGPLIGYAAFAIALSLLMPFTLATPLRAHDLAMVPGLIFSFVAIAPFGVVVAYMLGAIPAAVTGLFVGWSSSWLGERVLRRSGILLGAASSAVAVGQKLPDPSFVVAAALAGAAGAAALIRMTSGLRLRPMECDVKGGVTG